jgi:hypothetical protein
MRTKGLIAGLLLIAAGINCAVAAGPDVCTLLPVSTVNGLIHQNLSGVRPGVSEEAHSYGCSYGCSYGSGLHDAFIPPAQMTDEQLTAAEKALVLAIQAKL